MTIPQSKVDEGSARAEKSTEVSSGVGFTSVIRHLSLRGWLRWIHTNRSDASLLVRTRAGGHGNLWCKAGEVVDAEWGNLGPDAALQAMLGLVSGSVTIDFDPAERPRRITPQTSDVLRPGGKGAVADQAFRSTPSVPLSEVPPGPVLRSSLPRRLSRAAYVAGGLLLATLVLLAFAFGRSRAESESQPVLATAPEAQQTKAGLLPPLAAEAPPAAGVAPASTESSPAGPRELPVIPFVSIEVEPPQAEVWLDQVLIGLGRIDLARMGDGALHELRFVAAGHDTRSLFFLEAPPAGRVILERSRQLAAPFAEAEAAPPAEVVAAPVSRREAAAHPVVRRVARRPVPPPEPAASSTPANQPPQVQLIEAHTPRVQVLD